MKSKFSRKKIFYLLSLALILAAVFYAGFFLRGWRFSLHKTAVQTSASGGQQYPEALAFAGKNPSFSDLQTYYQNLANSKGARYAYEVLKRAEVPPNIDLHLLGHVVGDVLYKQEGLEGITDCTNDFRNACSHSIVTGLFFDKGEGALPEIAQACRKAPGGPGAYTMCFHGLGHGILAYEGYDMQKANAMCQKTGTAEYGYQEAAQCTGGTVMEIIGGGFHDREKWTIQRKRFLDPKQPLALCQSSWIPDTSKFMCYDYLTPYLFEAVGADPSNPTAADFKQAFQFCKPLDQTADANRDSCYGGFGKEFDGLVEARDIRQESLDKISDSQLQQVYQWCMLAELKEGKAACVVSAVNSLYWGGENNRGISIRFCSQVADDYNQKSCFFSLIDAVKYYITDQNYKQQFCGELPAGYGGECKSRLQLALTR